MPDGSGMERVSKSERDHRLNVTKRSNFKERMLHLWYSSGTKKSTVESEVMSENTVLRGHRFKFKDAALVAFTGAGGFFASGSSPELSIVFGVAVAGAIKAIDFAAPEIKR